MEDRRRRGGGGEGRGDPEEPVEEVEWEVMGVQPVCTIEEFSCSRAMSSSSFFFSFLNNLACLRRAIYISTIVKERKGETGLTTPITQSLSSSRSLPPLRTLLNPTRSTRFWTSLHHRLRLRFRSPRSGRRDRRDDEVAIGQVVKCGRPFGGREGWRLEGSVERVHEWEGGDGEGGAGLRSFEVRVFASVRFTERMMEGSRRVRR
jgi:hypothetical protein